MSMSKSTDKLEVIENIISKLNSEKNVKKVSITWSKFEYENNDSVCIELCPNLEVEFN